MNSLRKVRIMQIVDGKCPYCSQPVSEKPGKATKQINCVECGRLLNLPPKGGVVPLSKSASELKTFEPGLLFSTIIGIAFSTNSMLLTAITTGLGFVVMLLLWTQEDIPGLPANMRERAAGASERIRVFPFELYLIIFWVALLLFHLIKWYSIASYTLCLMMFMAAFMSIQATRFLRESKVTSSKINLFDVPLFIAIMLDPSKAFDRRKVEKGDGISQEHFFNAAAEKVEKEKIRAADSEEIAQKRAIRVNDRKAWEEDITKRYNKWLDEESTRLIQETTSR
ncbi:MAG: hypothetical protein NE327_01935 [Lentisphaeraceae bacterium]|nr:hypothetical protein [Lentisphaeraceae bacterium]